jgi:GNAT superfamily N-acetyltransferase
MTSSPETIRVAADEHDYSVFADLIREYVDWLQLRYADVPGLISGVGGHQAIDDELDHLPEKYGPPEGVTLLAVREGVITGAVAYRDLHDGTCEMKRMYVPERFQGVGTGRQLCGALIDHATEAGYRLMRLDTAFKNTEAMRMYTSMGFRECDPHATYPPVLQQHLRFMERPLGPEAPPA